MRSSFFDFYCDLGDVSELAVTSPVVAFLRESAMLREYFAGYGSRYLSSFGRLIALMAVQAAAYGALSWFLYAKRRAEAAGSALAFERIPHACEASSDDSASPCFPGCGSGSLRRKAFLCPSWHADRPVF